MQHIHRLSSISNLAHLLQISTCLVKIFNNSEHVPQLFISPILFHFSLSWFQIQPSEPTKIRFKSNLFGSFGAGLVTPINTIDFGNVFDNVGQKLIDNIRVVATIAVLLIAFIPFGVICRKLDKRDSFKVNKYEVNLPWIPHITLFIVPTI